MKVALTHDVDRTRKTYQYVSKFFKSLKRNDVDKMKYHIHSFFSKNNPYWNFNEIIRIENMFDVKSTFFFLNESINFNIFNISNWKLSLGRYYIRNDKIMEMIRYLDENGWEIGVHGSYNSYKNYQLLKNEKNILENIVGHEIIGTRQHYLNLKSKTWDIQKKCGFKYDSSFGYTNKIGFKNNIINPFYPLGEDFVVYPLAIMDNCFMSDSNKWDNFQKIINEVDINDAILVLNWHQRVFNEKEFEGYKSDYIKIIKLLKDRNAEFKTLSQYLKENNEDIN